MAEKKMGKNIEIEELVKTVSGKMLLKKLSEKREKYNHLIDLAILKNENRLLDKKNLKDQIRNDLEPLVTALLEKSRLAEDFFKFTLHTEENKKASPKKQNKPIDTLFKA